MSMISVKTKEGRVAFDAPRGNRIPTNKFVSVNETTWVRRLIDVHGDLEIQKTAPAAEAKAVK